MIPSTVIGNFIVLTGDPMNPVAKIPYKTNSIAPNNNFNGNWVPVPQDGNF